MHPQKEKPTTSMIQKSARTARVLADLKPVYRNRHDFLNKMTRIYFPEIAMNTQINHPKLIALIKSFKERPTPHMNSQITFMEYLHTERGLMRLINRCIRSMQIEDGSIREIRIPDIDQTVLLDDSHLVYAGETEQQPALEDDRVYHIPTITVVQQRWVQELKRNEKSNTACVFEWDYDMTKICDWYMITTPEGLIPPKIAEAPSGRCKSGVGDVMTDSLKEDIVSFFIALKLCD